MNTLYSKEQYIRAVRTASCSNHGVTDATCNSKMVDAFLNEVAAWEDDVTEVHVFGCDDEEPPLYEWDMLALLWERACLRHGYAVPIMLIPEMAG